MKFNEAQVDSFSLSVKMPSHLFIRMDRIQISMETDCIKLVKLYQVHSGKSLSQIGNAALRKYIINFLEEDSDFRDLAMAMKREIGSCVDVELSKEKYN